jgi:hypothetical protein
LHLLEVARIFEVLEFTIIWMQKVQLKTTTNSKGKGSAKEWTQTKVGGGSKIVENNISRRGVEKSKEKRSVEYLAFGYKVTFAFIIIFGMCRREGI